MAIAEHGIAAKFQKAVASLNLTVPVSVNVPLNALILLAACFDTVGGVGDNSPSDTVGNNYNEVCGSTLPDSSIQVLTFSAPGALALPALDIINIAAPAGLTFNIEAGAVYFTGLTSGASSACTALADSGTNPLIDLTTLVDNALIVGLIGVKGPSTDGFTQDPNFADISPRGGAGASDLLTAYAGWMQGGVKGVYPWRPVLGVAREYVALLMSFQP